MSFTSPGGPKTVQCFTDQSADETLSPFIDVRGYTSIVFYVTGTGTTSSGVITIEECAPKDLSIVPVQPYGATTGAFSVVTTQNASAVTGGLQVAVHLPQGAYCFVRPRISAVIGGGGTISVGMVAY